MAEEKDLIFKDFQRGIADSSLLGYADMRNVLIDEVPGGVSCALVATKESATTIGDLVQWIVQDPATADLFAQDLDGKVYTSTDDGDSWSLVSGNTLPTANTGGQGMAVWEGYLFVARPTA